VIFVKPSLRVLCAALLLGCGAQGRGGPDAGNTAQAGGCPPRAAAPSLLPGTEPKHQTLEYWLSRYPAAELDASLMSQDQIAAYNVAIGRSGTGSYSQRNLLAAIDEAELGSETRERLGYLRERIDDERYVTSQGQPLAEPKLAAFDAGLPAPLAPSLRVALELVPLRCGPLDEPLLEKKTDGSPTGAYDRNACSSVRAQDVVQVLAPWPGGMQLARTRYAFGFLPANAALSPPVPDELAAAYVTGPRARAEAAIELALEGGAEVELDKHTALPLLPDGRVLVATARGFSHARSDALVPVRRALTRRQLLTTGVSFLDSPYGFGDARGGRDCSRLTLDLFEAFDLSLPRHSGWQAQAGTLGVDLAGMSPSQKLEALKRAARLGAVLLHLPGHVMLHLGENDAGAPMALHALGEYVQPCAGGGETVIDLQRTVVSDLALGKGSSRGSLLERLTALVVLGSGDKQDLAGAQPRTLAPLTPPEAGAECKDTVDARIFVSPARPIGGKPLRMIATTDRAAKAQSVFVFDPEGKLLSTDNTRLGGPPFGFVARLPRAEAGRYTVLFRDGDATLACKRVTVHDGPLAPEPLAAGAPVWPPRWSWERDTLNLWSTFVEQLFDDPADDERTWTDLHTLLRDARRNLLHDHLGLGEDERLELVPDCADLPFVLRAYFAWKLQLPFAYRQCARGRSGVPPSCGAPITNLMPREADDPVDGFARFANRNVRSGVHSASGRTHPEDSETDLYPVALERASLPPGTVYADPYGHVMILTKWFPQGAAADAYGILIAAEAQPDNTIGRRRFFRGSFLFDPSTEDVGAGFKHFRPLVHDKVAKALVPLDNAALAESEVFPRFSLAQYQGSQDDFYDRMDRLINPAPLDAATRLRSLLDALEEAARRRVLAVDTGEQYMRANPGTVAMPSGHDIFETTGPWEDYATPSRDMRLLIALDTVLALPDQVLKDPTRFKLADRAAAERVAKELRASLDRELAARSFSYTRSDGSAQRLTLRNVFERKQALEIAYNPNDCVELRWGAPDAGSELSTCTRRAPREQAAKMERYRTWFRTRTRPARGTGD
jgi:hypothetical protein